MAVQDGYVTTLGCPVRFYDYCYIPDYSNILSKFYYQTDEIPLK